MFLCEVRTNAFCKGNCNAREEELFDESFGRFGVKILINHQFITQDNEILFHCRVCKPPCTVVQCLDINEWTLADHRKNR